MLLGGAAGEGALMPPDEAAMTAEEVSESAPEPGMITSELALGLGK